MQASLIELVARQRTADLATPCACTLLTSAVTSPSNDGGAGPGALPSSPSAHPSCAARPTPPHHLGPSAG